MEEGSISQGGLIAIERYIGIYEVVVECLR